MKVWKLSVAAAIAAALAWSCSNSASTNACTPGQSIACAGTNGCAGNQTCNADGTYGACQCAPADAGQIADSGGAPDSSPADADAAAPDAGDDASSWLPSQLSGLVLWLQQSGLPADAGAVSAWNDSSGGQRNFTAKQVAPTRDPAAIGGKDAVKFQADPLTSAQNAFSWGTANLVIEMVTKLGACAGGCPLWSMGAGMAVPPVLLEAVGGDAGGNVVLQGLIQPDIGLSAPFATGVHVVGVRRTGSTTAEVRVDGKATSFTLSSNIDLSTGGVAALGVYEDSISNTTKFLSGDIAEVIAAKQPSDSDVSQIEGYLKAKYGL